MTAVNLRHFDTLRALDRAKENGFTEQQARFIAQELELIQETNAEKISAQVLEKELSQFATKADLKDVELRLNNSINSATNKLITVITVVIAIASFFIKFH